jgi:hypothetical protein
MPLKGSKSTSSVINFFRTCSLELFTDAESLSRSKSVEELLSNDFREIQDLYEMNIVVLGNCCIISEKMSTLPL